MDKIENNCKGTPAEKEYSNMFGGQLTHELICQDCPHRSSRDEPFLTISVDTQAKDSLSKGLQAFISGEMLEGENAYYCEKCDKKIDTMKRQCIRKLPNILIVVLKRFNFNLETFQREKINEYFSYTDTLDMRDYC